MKKYLLTFTLLGTSFVFNQDVEAQETRCVRATRDCPPNQYCEFRGSKKRSQGVCKNYCQNNENCLPSEYCHFPRGAVSSDTRGRCLPR